MNKIRFMTIGFIISGTITLILEIFAQSYFYIGIVLLGGGFLNLYLDLRSKNKIN